MLTYRCMSLPICMKNWKLEIIPVFESGGFSGLGESSPGARTSIVRVCLVFEWAFRQLH